MSDVFAADLLSFDMPLHVVFDGAHVKNLRGRDIEERLASYKLKAHPLFRETMDRASRQAGPWLLPVESSRDAIERVLAPTYEFGRSVFWLGESSTDILFTHLRKLNAARMPDARIVYFRHYDPDVLANVIPLLDPEQAAHLFGSSKAIALYGGTASEQSTRKPDGLPPSEAGPITFQDWQIEVLDDRQRRLSRMKIANLIRAEFPSETRTMSASGTRRETVTA